MTAKNKIQEYMAACKFINIGIAALVFALIAGKLFSPGNVMAQDGDKSAVMENVNHTDTAVAEDDGEEPVIPLDAHKAKVMAFAFMGAAIATGLGSIGAGVAVSNVGAAAMGAVAEKPELMGKSLIYVALAEGIAIYGLLISIVILSKI